MVAPANTPSLTESPSGSRRTISWFSIATRSITFEQVAWLILLVSAILTRFWNLGARAMHHDESLHAWFSYQYAIGKGYQHDPLMHGPFLFHLNALVYALFGATDASSRYGPALFGTMLVMLPILLRPLIGRWGALICGVLILVNPGILYYSRLLRHDVYLMFFTFLLLAAIGRYVQRPDARWVYVAFLALAFAHTNHEASYLIAVLLGAFLFLVLTWQVARPLLAVTFGYLALLAADLLVLPKLLHWDKLPKIPWDAQANEMNWAHWEPYLRTVLMNPKIYLAIFLTIFYLFTAIYILSVLRLRETEPGTTPNDRLFGGWRAGTVVDAMHRLILDKRALFCAMTVAFFFWTLLYTSLFTNIGGIFSGAFYSVIYWAGQQDVFRGGQPWYYFLFLFPLSGPVCFTIGLPAAGVTVWRFIQYLRGKRPMSARLFFQLMIVWYGFGILGALTMAGEKMPWLVDHIMLPFIILSASYLGEAIEYLTALWRMPTHETLPIFRAVRPAGVLGIVATAPRVREESGVRISPRVRDCTVLGAIVLFLVGWFFTVSRISENPGGDIRFLLLMMPVVLIGVVVLYALRYGWKRAISIAALAVAIPLAFFELHLGWNLALFDGDVPRDMLVYTQTAPDIPMMMNEINALSKERTGGYDLPIWYSSATVWPMNWYLRDYMATGAAHFFGASLQSPPPDDAAIIMVGNEDFGPWEDQNLQNYERTDYVMRWWFPEEIYRAFTYSPPAPRPDYPGLWEVNAQGKEVRPTWGDTIKKAWESIRALADPPQRTQVVAQGSPSSSVLSEEVSPSPTSNLWRFIALREPPHTIESYNFHLYVRKDLVRELNGIRY